MNTPIFKNDCPVFQKGQLESDLFASHRNKCIDLWPDLHCLRTWMHACMPVCDASCFVQIYIGRARLCFCMAFGWDWRLENSWKKRVSCTINRQHTCWLLPKNLMNLHKFWSRVLSVLSEWHLREYMAWKAVSWYRIDFQISSFCDYDEYLLWFCLSIKWSLLVIDHAEYDCTGFASIRMHPFMYPSRCLSTHPCPHCWPDRQGLWLAHSEASEHGGQQDACQRISSLSACS